MKKIKVVAKREDEYEIQIDPEVFTSEYLASWSKIFHAVETLEEIVEALSFLVLRFGTGGFFEGFGYIQTFYSDGQEMCQRLQPGEKFAPGIKLRILAEDDQHEFDLTEVENGS